MYQQISKYTIFFKEHATENTTSHRSVSQVMNLTSHKRPPILYNLFSLAKGWSCKAETSEYVYIYIYIYKT